MVTHRQQGALFDVAVGDLPVPGHQYLADVVVIVTGVILAVVLLSGPRPLSVPELDARMSNAPPRISTPPALRVSDIQAYERDGWSMQLKPRWRSPFRAAIQVGGGTGANNG